MQKIEIAISYASRLASHIQRIFDEECSDDNFIDWDEMSDEKNLTAFVHAMSTLAPHLVYSNITGDNTKDIVDYNHLANKLCFQFSKREGEV